MTDSRVPRWSDQIDTTPYETSGRIATMASSSAKRTAIRRIAKVIDLISARHPLVVTGRPETEGREDVAARLGRDGEAPADCACALAPGDEQRGRVVHERLLHGGNGRAELRFVCGVAGTVECCIDRRVAAARGVEQAL